MLCVADAQECPLTGISLTVDPNSGALSLSESKEPTSLPLSAFKFSTGTPCINYSEEPASTLGQLEGEYTYSAEGCSEDSFLEVTYNTNYFQVSQDFVVNQGELEQANFI